MCQNGGIFYIKSGKCKTIDDKRYCECPAYSYGDFCEKLKCEFCETSKCLMENKCKSCFESTNQHEVCKYFKCDKNNNPCENNGSFVKLEESVNSVIINGHANV